MLPIDEILAIAFAVIAIVSYHVVLCISCHVFPHRTIISLSFASRRRWIKFIMAKQDAILCVQTLRNGILHSSILSTASITVVVGLVAFLSSNFATAAGSIDSVQISTKIGIIIVLFFLAFFCFTQSMRMANHVSFTIFTSTDDTDVSIGHELNETRIAAMLNRSGIFQTIGMRFLYTTAPFVFWIYGYWMFLGSALALVCVLLPLDFI